MTKITVPIKVESLAKLESQLELAKAGGADFVELRLDYWPQPEDLWEHTREIVSKAKAFGFGIVATCRANWEGGAYNGSEQVRMNILKTAAASGADYIDIEYKAAEKDLPEFHPAQTIVSYHDFEKKPYDLQDIVNSITSLNSQVIAKIAFKANRISESFEALDLLKENPGMIAIAMGYEGIITRILAGKLGALLTFATINDSESTADGQITINEMLTKYHVNKLDEQTKVYGIIGAPVSHSRSPEIHNKGFAEIGFNGVYLPLLVQPDEFEEFMDSCLARPWLDMSGFSVTIPHKHNALEYVKSRQGQVDQSADKIGASNTIIISPSGTLSCFNTDYYGALKAITDVLSQNNLSLSGMSAGVIGAGGVSRAIVAGLIDHGAKVTIYNRTLSRAIELSESFGCNYGSSSEVDNTDAKLLVNCTSIGMEPDIDSSPISDRTINSDMVVFDTVYTPLETKLLKSAIAAGAKTVSGLDMFINQAEKQFELFTGTNKRLTI